MLLSAVSNTHATADQWRLLSQTAQEMESESRMADRGVSEVVVDQARALLANGFLAGELLRDIGQVGTPLAVMNPDGQVQSWLAPVLADDLIAGFFRTDCGLSDWRWIGFQGGKDSLARCPPAAMWLDRSEILRRAAALAQPGERVMGPVLTFDRVPDRLAWAVRLVAADGGERTVFVAGRAAWPAMEGPVDSYDGR
jgi:hypothetical protein